MPGAWENARGVRENLWPKFIPSNAPLRATSSIVFGSILGANRKPLKIQGSQVLGTGRNCQMTRKIYVSEADARSLPKKLLKSRACHP